MHVYGGPHQGENDGAGIADLSGDSAGSQGQHGNEHAAGRRRRAPAKTGCRAVVAGSALRYRTAQTVRSEGVPRAPSRAR